jgi:hypothetical protein
LIAIRDFSFIARPLRKSIYFQQIVSVIGRTSHAAAMIYVNRAMGNGT